MKSIELETEENDVETILLASFVSVTPDDCSGWVHHTGHYS